MAVNFPDSPSVNDTFTSGTRTYQYDGTSWRLFSSTAALAPDTPTGTETYTNLADLPLSGNDAGTQAYVAENNRLYIWNGSGWFNIALINTAPSITGGGAGSYALAADGTPTVITLTAEDPEGLPITWSYQVTAGSLGSTATIEQADNVFTITPSTNEAHAGQFSITFTASDGVNIATDVNSFTLAFGRLITYLVVGGGGGGGNGWAGGGGGGAGGGVLTGQQTLSSGTTYNIFVGQGGAGAVNSNGDTRGGIGDQSQFVGVNTVTAGGGGAGGGFASINTGLPATPGDNDGASGGGGACVDPTTVSNLGGTGSGTGGDGGDGFNGSGGSQRAAGGGGGAGGSAADASLSSPTNGGDGVGIALPLSQTTVFYGAGGGGGTRSTPIAIGGSSGAGGNGGNATTQLATDATTYGSGGGGGAGRVSLGQTDGGDGESGVVMIKSTVRPVATTGSPTEYIDGIYYIQVFTSDGSITF